ncbi:MAG: hypothetical protein ACLRFL_01685 [Clostridia bacterium]
MSKLKIKNWHIFILVALLSMFLFGCDNDVPVNSISFNLGEESQIVMLVDQELDMNQFVDIRPAYATNKNYSITSSDASVLSVNGSVITAHKEGECVIRLVSKENSKKEDIMTIRVKESIEVLDTPRNLQFDTTLQAFTFEMVDNASNYIININGEDYSVGNSNIFPISKYVGNSLDCVMTAKVKAEASRFSFAYQSSPYTEIPYQYYQTAPVTNMSIVGGKLSFDSNTTASNIFINGELYEQITINEFSLKELDEKYAGQNVLIGVQAVVDQEIIDSLEDGVKDYNSLKIEKNVQVLDIVRPTMVSSTVSWNNVIHSAGYKVYIDNVNIVNNKVLAEDIDENKGVITANYFNLDNLENIETLINSNKISNIKVLPILRQDSENLAMTGIVDNISVSRLTTPEFSLDEEVIHWNSIDSATTYLLTIKTDDQLTQANIRANEFDLSNFDAGEQIEIAVSANSSGEVSGVYYLYSSENSCTITKNEDVDPVIENYVLKFGATSGEKYRINFSDKDGDIQIEIDEDLDLSEYVFNAGVNEISICHLGNKENTINSEIAKISFTQLEAINAISMNNSTASVVRSNINKNAIIELRTQIGGTIKSIQDTMWEYNTIDASGENYLPAGSYVTYVYVLGDGVNTFSYREKVGSNLTEVATASINFEVLSNPNFDNVFDKTNNKVSFSTIENADNYQIYTLVEGVYTATAAITDNEYLIALNAGETKNIKVQAVGNGVEYLTSVMSRDINVKKLLIPTLEYDNSIDEFSIENEDLDHSTYEIVHNGDTKVLSDISLVTGENIISITAIAKDREGVNYYINSATNSITINKIDATSEIKVENNSLIITPNHTAGYEIVVKYSFGESVTAEYKNGKYTIPLVDTDYNIIYDEMKSDFGVTIQYLAPADDDSIATSDEYAYPNTFVLEQLSKPVLIRDDQNIVFDNVNEDYTLNNYKLIIDGEKSAINSFATLVDNTITISAKKLLDTAGDGVHDIAIEVNDPTKISVVSDPISIERKPKVQVSYAKDNTALENSATLTITAPQNLDIYFREYPVVIGDYSMTFTRTEMESGELIIILDEIDLLAGNNQVKVSTTTDNTSQYNDGTKVVFVFNSLDSDVINIKKITAPTNLYVSDSILHFTAVEGAVGYEIYDVDGNEYTKINDELIENNSYLLNNITTNRFIAVKAISNTEMSTNSSYTEYITICPVVDPVINISYGHFAITIDPSIVALKDVEQATTKLTLTTKNDLYTIDLKNVDNSLANLNGNILTIYADQVLAYEYSDLTAEDINITINITYLGKVDGDIYLLNPKEVEDSAYGLFAPINVKKTTDSENDYVDFLTWSKNVKNELVDEETLETTEIPENYVIKIIYTDQAGEEYEYLSTDDGLKYKEGSNYYSYGLINTTKVRFPYGYDENGDGKFEAIFADGNYLVYVQTITTHRIEGYKICASMYSSPCSFSIMAKPILQAYDGVLSWNACIGATSYNVEITNESRVYKVTVDTNEYDFSSLDVSGVCGVKVKAVSTRNNVLNSAVSDELKIYRLPQVTKVVLDDGMLKFTADRYFTSAKVILKDKINNTTQETIYDNLDKTKTELSTMKIELWTNQSLSSPIVYVIEDEILKAIDGKSYDISIQLIGESINLGTVEIDEVQYNLSGLMMINSKIANSFDLVLDKLVPNTYGVTKGVVDYSPSQTITKINYVFSDSETNSFWESTTIYRIILKTPTETHTIYALDYNDFINNSSTLDYISYTEQNELCAGVKYSYGGESLYFNVYTNNIMDIANYNEVYYHVIDRTISDGEISYTSSATLSRIDVSSGGTFFIDVGILGGDMYATGVDALGNPSAYKGYITSYNNDLKPFVKYGVNTLSTHSGLVQIKDMIEYDEDGNIIDYPIYKLTMMFAGEEEIERIIYYYPYDDTKYTELEARGHLDTIKNKNDRNSDVIFVLKKYSEIEGVVLIDFAELKDALGEYIFNSNEVYNITIQTLAGIGNNNEDDDYLLNAKLPDGNSTNTYYKYSTTEVRVNGKGVLEFDMSYVTINSSRKYAQYYEITLSDGSETKYIYIKADTEGVVFNNVDNVVTYVLPDEFDGSEYSIAVRAISYIESTVDHNYADGVLSFNRNASSLYRLESADRASIYIDISKISNNITIDGDTITYICPEGYLVSAVYSVNTENGRLNASYPSEMFIFGRMAKATNLGIYDGMLKWQADDSAHNFYFHISYLTDPEDLDSLVEISFDTPGIKDGDWYTYQFTDYADYSVVGSNNTTKLSITSQYDYKISIMVVGNKINNMINSGYTVPTDMKRLDTITNITTSDGVLVWDEIESAVSYYIELNGNKNYTYTATSNSYDLTGKIDAGEYSVRIRAIGGGDINAINSDNVRGFIKLGQIVYKSINIDKNIISWDPIDNATKYRVSFEYGEYSIDDRFIDTYDTYVTAFDDIVGTFNIYIRAFGVGADKHFSGENVEFRCETTVPEAISEIFYDEDSNEYYWSAENYTDGDVFNISYNLAQYTSAGLGPLQAKSYNISYYKSMGQEFRYPITTMGVYTDFKVYVTRANTVWSATTEYVGDSDGIIDLDLYAYGDGSDEANAYIIKDVAQLLNIKYFANREMYFKLGDSLDLSEIENIMDIVLANDGGLFCSSFNGVFDGNGYVFYDAIIELNDIEKFSLFGELNSAIIKNIEFGQENGIILSNSFANKVENVVQLSLIATGANNSTIQNVSGKTIFNISGNINTEKNIYIAGLIAQDKGSEIMSDDPDLKLSVSVSIAANIEFATARVGSYISGLVAEGMGTNVSNCNVDFTLSSSSACTYVAGLIAYFDGNNQNAIIEDTDVTINISNVNIPYLGGAVGYGKNITIDNCTVLGNINNNAVALGVYIGGIIGLADSDTITNNTVEIVFNLTCNNATGDRFIGAIIGRGMSCTTSGNTTTYTVDDETSYNNGSVELGLYGKII